MKKALLLLWIIFYLGTASGATVHLHYCMGKIIGWGLREARPSATCPSCGMHKKPGNNCCGDVPQCTSTEKQDLVVSATSLPFLPDQFSVILPFILYHFSPIALAFHGYSVKNIFVRPPGPEMPVFLKNCVFRI
ncbi:hypothetical protein GA0116948_104254 [Chitinophaga costaii]|uniref:Uncharacterized protein n=1 Tax=Chitinophaga costaii TaxID=1335309 RepID=A0A1C4CR79_9BACT|nr:hypothetical protein [Chitinophaga costaii]PUZ26986.1 hypothetical protein DCM91_07035 [Chitinophaga costaii]SCC21588.1 hypothetical protein GA0116948_104254 [Chitinophaga costaii]